MKKLITIALVFLLTVISLERAPLVYAEDYPTLQDINLWIWNMYLPPTYANATEECKKIIIKKGDAPGELSPVTADESYSGAIQIYRDGDDLVFSTTADKFNVPSSTTGTVFGNGGGGSSFQYVCTIENLDMIRIPEGSTVTGMFSGLGINSQDPININFNDLDTSNVVDATNFFGFIGANTDKSIKLDVSSMNVSNMEIMKEMFKCIGVNTPEAIQIDLSSWDVSKVKNMDAMFSNFAKKSSNFPLNISSWNVSSVESMESMFLDCGSEQPNPINLDLSSWNVSNVKSMADMFSYFGQDASSTINLDISSWNVSNVENMAGMFSNFAKNIQTAPQLDLSSWNVSGVKNMKNMFGSYAQNSLTPVSINLSSWDVSNVEDISFMFYEFARNVTAPVSVDLSSWDVSNVNEMKSMFNRALSKSSNADINLSNWTIKDDAETVQMFGFVADDEFTGTVKLNLSNWKVLSSDQDKFNSLFCSDDKYTISNPNLTIDLSGYGAVENAPNPFMREPTNGGTVQIDNIGKIIIPNKTKILNASGEVIGYKENSPTMFYYNNTSYETFDNTLPVYLSYSVNYHIGDDATTTEGAPLSGVYTGSLLIDDFVSGKNNKLLTASQVNKPSYSFKGWYDNPELTGSPITAVDISSFDTSDSIDLYAKWEVGGSSSPSNNTSSRHVVLNTSVY